jgi:hypothetical protein
MLDEEFIAYTLAKLKERYPHDSALFEVVAEIVSDVRGIERELISRRKMSQQKQNN